MTRPFGRAMLAEFPLEPGAIYLNHGTVGVTPRAVLARRAALLEEIERHPARFMLRELMRRGPPRSVDTDAAASAPTRMRAAAADVAGLVGARGDDVVFVDNATSGVNAVLRSLPLAAGDEILVPDLAYGAVARAAAHIGSTSGASVVTVPLPFPVDEPSACTRAIAAAITPRTRLAILDHISSETALVFPLAEMAAACRTRGVPVLVDGAHAPGALALDVRALGVDWYAANLHKWAFAPRSSGLLWAAPERQPGLHPAIISWGVTSGDWRQEFDWTGTRDPTPWLAAPAGIDFMRDALGGAEVMRRHNHALAWQAANELARRWKQPLRTPEAMVGCMACVPLPKRLGPADASTAERLRDALLHRHRIEIPVIARGDALWLRLSAQVYNDERDIEALAAAVDQLN